MTTLTAMKRATLALLAVGLSMAVCPACGDRDTEADKQRSVTERPQANTRDLAGGDGTVAIDEPLMIALAQAKNFHHKADVYLREGDLDQAIDSVKQIVAIPFPDGAPEAEDIDLDARARLASLLATQGETDEAMKVADQGIDRATRRSFFLANLYTAKGEVYEAMANVLDDEENDEARLQAREARRNAIEAFDQSITINRELQRALMEREAPQTPDGGTK